MPSVKVPHCAVHLNGGRTSLEYTAKLFLVLIVPYGRNLMIMGADDCLLMIG